MRPERISCSEFLTLCAVIQSILVSYLVLGSPLISHGQACTGGRFIIGQKYDPFSADYFFTPMLAFGSFSFSTVKAIDITWDLCVGRGGQAIFIYIAYRVFTESLAFSMESEPVPYQVFAAIAFDAVSISTIGVLGRECIALWKRTWRRRLTIVGLILVSSYILAFPTLVSALTGYDENYGPYVDTTVGSMFPFSGFGEGWVVWDSSRVGLTDGGAIEIEAGRFSSGISGALYNCKLSLLLHFGITHVRPNIVVPSTATGIPGLPTPLTDPVRSP